MSLRPWKRGYVFAGAVAHIIPEQEGKDTTFGGFGRSLCGMEAPTWAPWFGTGNQQEIDKANRLPLCKACINNVHSHKFDLEHTN